MKSKKGKEIEPARNTQAHLERIVDSMALPMPAGYSLDPVIFLVILLLYVPVDATLLRAKAWMQRNPTVKEKWDAWSEGHRREKEKLGFANAKEHLSAFIQNDLRVIQAFVDKKLLPVAGSGSPLPPHAPEDPTTMQPHLFRPNSSIIPS